jgi:hypothetical protein
VKRFLLILFVVAVLAWMASLELRYWDERARQDRNYRIDAIQHEILDFLLEKERLPPPPPKPRPQADRKS